MNLTIQNRGAFLKMQTDAVALDADIKAMIKDIAREYQGIVRSELSRGKSGRLYGATGRVRFRTVRKRVEVFGGKRRTVSRRVVLKGGTRAYRASRPGEAPATFTGNMLRSLKAVFPSKEKGYGAKVKTGRFPHRHLLEFGAGPARKGKRIGAGGYRAPRPLWTPLQARAIEDLERRVLRVIDASAAFRG